MPLVLAGLFDGVVNKELYINKMQGILFAVGFNTPPLGAVRISNTDKNW
jgi:hypothetical protein